MSWYFVERGERVGPLAEEEFSVQVDAGRIAGETLVWQDGMAGWKPLREVRAVPGAAEGTAACTECGRRRREDELIRWGERRVCAACKPTFLQRLREGHLTAGLLRYGDFWPRFGAKLLDGVLLWIVNFPIQMVLMGSMMMNPDPSMESFWRRYALAMGLNFAIQASYSIGMNGRWGATLGKKALKLKIVQPDGSPIGYGKAAARFFAEWVNVFTLLIGYVIAAFDDERRALHDRICDTRVIRAA